MCISITIISSDSVEYNEVLELRLIVMDNELEPLLLLNTAQVLIIDNSGEKPV